VELEHFNEPEATHDFRRTCNLLISTFDSSCPVGDITSGKGILINDSKTSYHDWLLHEVDQAICRSIRNPGWGHPIHFLRRRLRVKDVLPCQSISRLAIKHGDTNALNVLVHRGELSGLELSCSTQVIKLTDIF